MDPEAAIRLLMAQIQEKDVENVVRTSWDLYQWISKGGFAPSGNEVAALRVELRLRVGHPIVGSYRLDQLLVIAHAWAIGQLTTAQRIGILAERS